MTFYSIQLTLWLILFTKAMGYCNGRLRVDYVFLIALLIKPTNKTNLSTNCKYKAILFFRAINFTRVIEYDAFYKRLMYTMVQLSLIQNYVPALKLN